jgi:hypothetical protein
VLVAGLDHINAAKDYVEFGHNGGATEELG